MRCPRCGADMLDHKNDHLICNNPDCDFAEETEMIIFTEKEDYFHQKEEPCQLS